jgi:hypothetical protein
VVDALTFILGDGHERLNEGRRHAVKEIKRIVDACHRRADAWCYRLCSELHLDKPITLIVD